MATRRRRTARRRPAGTGAFLRFTISAGVAFALACLFSQYAAVVFAAAFLIAWSPMARGAVRFALAAALLLVIGTVAVRAYRRSARAQGRYGPRPGGRLDVTSPWMQWLSDAPAPRARQLPATVPTPRQVAPARPVAYQRPRVRHSVGGAFEVMAARRAAGVPIATGGRTAIDPPRHFDIGASTTH